VVALIFKVLAAAVTLKRDGRRSKKKTANSPINATAGYKRKRRQNGRKNKMQEALMKLTSTQAGEDELQAQCRRCC